MCAECGMGFAMMSYLPTEKRLAPKVGMVISSSSMRRPGCPGSLPAAGGSDLLGVRGARRLRALLALVLHLGVRLQRLGGGRLDGGEVNEEILAAVVGGDEAE